MRSLTWIATTVTLAMALTGCGQAPVSQARTRSEVPLASRSGSDVIQAAHAMALATLKRNTRKVTIDGKDRTVIVAGGGHFGALWTRDGMYAALGLLSAGETVPVKDSLEALWEHQRPDGLIPRRIGSGSNAVGILRNAIGLKPKDDTRFQTLDFAKESVDAPALALWVSHEYVQQTRDQAFLKQHYPAMTKAIAWLMAKEADGLLNQADYMDWKDMNARGGKVLYSNAVYYKALCVMGEMAAQADDGVGATRYRMRAEALAGRIRTAFWNPERGHFRDTLVLEDFSAEGDFFAVLFGLASDSQRASVFKRADALMTLKPLLPALDGDYPAAMIPFQLKVAGIRQYHDRFMWPWLTDLYALTAAESGDKATARRAIERVSRLALRDGTFHEIYEGTAPVPVKRKLYASEPDFSWHAGLFVKAYRAAR